MIAQAITAPEVLAIRAVSVDPNTLYTARETAQLRRIRLDGHGPRCIWLSKRKSVYREIDIQIWIAERARAHRQPTPAA